MKSRRSQHRSSLSILKRICKGGSAGNGAYLNGKRTGCPLLVTWRAMKVKERREEIGPQGPTVLLVNEVCLLCFDGKGRRKSRQKVQRIVKLNRQLVWKMRLVRIQRRTLLLIRTPPGNSGAQRRNSGALCFENDHLKRRNRVSSESLL